MLKQRDHSNTCCIFHSQYVLLSNRSKYLDFAFEKPKKYFPSHLCRRLINLIFTSCMQPRPKYPQDILQAVFAAVVLQHTNLLQDFFSEYLL